MKPGFINFTGRVVDMQQKYVAKPDRPTKVVLTIKLEITDGLASVPKLAETLTYPVDVRIDPVQHVIQS